MVLSSPSGFLPPQQPLPWWLLPPALHPPLKHPPFSALPSPLAFYSAWYSGPSSRQVHLSGLTNSTPGLSRLASATQNSFVNPETAHLPAFVPAVLSGKLHSAAFPVILLALTCLCKLSSAITSPRRLTRLSQVVQGPPPGSHNPLCFGHIRAPTWAAVIVPWSSCSM